MSTGGLQHDWVVVFFIAGIWVLVAIAISARLPRWLGVTRHTKTASLLLFPMVLVVPIADELIGRWQFRQLCEREAVVTLSPGWESVKRARKQETKWNELKGYLIPVSLARIETFDVDTGKVFMTSQSPFTKGGFLMRHGLGLDGTSACHSESIKAIQEQVNLFELLRKGETK